jgi:hypothetical protein
MNLTGKNNIHNLNLSGKNSFVENIPMEVKSLKIKIMNAIIIPLISRQWNTLNENIFLLNSFKKSIHFYYQNYKLEELIIYRDLLNILEILVGEHIQLENMEKQMYGKSENSENLTQMVYKTTMIRLKPEYEIYDNIIGKPKREKNESYNELIIKDIQLLLKSENITFNKMKDILLPKYGTDIK